MSDIIIECTINILSLKRALSVTPPEFAAAYDWFQRHEGKSIPRLPMGSDAPEDVTVKLASQRGIHHPSYEQLPSKGAGRPTYALSVHSEGQRYYADKDVILRPEDGTWTLDYQEHATSEGKRNTDRSNEYLMRNLEDGVPVGVMVRDKRHGGYNVLGLAFVEQYNAETGTFTLHGPVNEMTELRGSFLEFPTDSLTDEQARRAKNLGVSDINDERSPEARRYVRTLQRERQSKFRQDLMAAYEGTCAVSDTNVVDALQAAHIDPYRGRRSQIVQNGILLRADIHLLYDANLVAIEPETHVLRLAESIKGSIYERYAGTPIAVPKDTDLRPSDELLGRHYEQFIAAWRHAA
ncbi:hypothetical protein HMPREF1008_01442 [Olsenella sp. oral taxon 809 str. F0356]|uniref:HNH endonuclease n=1 Tax=Olsenella sp. oral taxon 809 TaxID=661086 RepID=UPI000231EE83|nr:HNH endonuclease [Olsenella sp. oral taxon 809]EHF01818.1 hypothetical protein HMPREF1008_01442 [Olsenella sp. oral taxon 809 str. F0356]